MMDDIHKARFAEFDEHFELVARLERHVSLTGTLFVTFSFCKSASNAQTKLDLVFCLMPVSWPCLALQGHETQDHYYIDIHHPSTRRHRVISDKKVSTYTGMSLLWFIPRLRPESRE